MRHPQSISRYKRSFHQYNNNRTRPQYSSNRSSYSHNHNISYRHPNQIYPNMAYTRNQSENSNQNSKMVCLNYLHHDSCVIQCKLPKYQDGIKLNLAVCKEIHELYKFKTVTIHEISEAQILLCHVGDILAV